ncbi:MAG: hypothetical protein Q9166_000302 [cf. Caloplaca sp. 2 TL-2023]
MTIVHEQPDYDFDLTAEDASALEAARLLNQRTTAEIRGVSAVLLHPPSVYSDLDLVGSATSTATVSFRHLDAPPTRTLDIPNSYVSAAAVEFCGFNPKAAQAIFERYAGRSHKGPDELVDYILADILGADFILKRVGNTTPTPSQMMACMGLAQTVQNTIMDPAYDEVRKTEPITFWVVDTVETRWNALLQLKLKLKDTAERLRERRAQQPSPTSTAQAMPEGLQTQRNLPSAFVSLGPGPPAELPDHRVIYKAIAATDLITEDRGLVLGTRLERRHVIRHGGDFCNGGTASYWTPDRSTAKQYYNYARARCPFTEVWMLQVQVSKAFLGNLKIKELWYGPEWKDFVWNSKKPRNRLPEYADIVLIKGHISKGNDIDIRQIDKEDVRASMNEKNAMVNPDGRRASQWVFLREGLFDRFDDEIKGKLHIEIAAPLVLR